MYEELVKRLRSHNGWALNKTLDEAANAIESTNKAYQMISEAYEAEVTKQNWIPVTERLPDNIDEEVLVCNEGYGKDGTGFATVAVYNGNGWLECWERKQYLACITYWMPLPEPPKEEGGNMKTICFDDAMDRKVFSRDLREYVVPIRELQALRKIEVTEEAEDAPDQKAMLRVLFNRCMALTRGQTCFFCGMRKACDIHRSVMQGKGE